MLHGFVVAAAAQEPFDSVGVCWRQVGSRKTGKGARMTIRAKPGDHVARARRARNTAEVTDGGTRGRRRVSHMRQMGAERVAADTTPCSDGNGHAPVRAIDG